MQSVKNELLAALAAELEKIAPGAGDKAAFESPKQAAHGDLFRPAWWRDLQSHLAAGDYPDTPPYPDTLRLA